MFLHRVVCGLLPASVQTAGFAKLVKFRYLVKHWKIAVGDKVHIVNGDDNGKTGEVIEVDKNRNVLKVRGCKLRKVHGKERMVEKFIHYSNVNLLDPVLKVPTRIAVKDLKGEMVRLSKRSGCIIPFPAENRKSGIPEFTTTGPLDTSAEVALKKTYNKEQDVVRLKQIRANMSKYNLSLH